MKKKINYEVLTPNNMIENKAEDALKFAFKNKKSNNIAITGPYSSGKSSIIQSYINKNIKKKHYLNISLATFEKIDNAKSKESNSLEKIIIEKLYYSILKKHNTQKDIKESIVTMIFVILVNVGIYLFNMKAINNSLDYNLEVTTVFIALEIVFLTILTSYLISYLMNLQEIKLKLGDVEVKVNQDSNERNNVNLLNEELGFIVKIMNISKYKYIIFEDLDRFENPKIFERLRDLNITLNSTLKHKVKFIYAIRDELITSENRTKFFDFIIPVVPYVSYETSGEELLKMIKKYDLENELSEDFILDISLYVSDIRILKNTVNEYLIYKKNLEKILPNYERLFSILLYKNTCSKDFAKLQNKEGKVYECFKNKDEKISQYISTKQSEVDVKRKDYNKLEKNLISKNNFEKLAIYMIKSNISSNNSITLQNSKGNTIGIQYVMNTDNILEKFISDENTTIEYVYGNSWRTEKLRDFYKSNCPEFWEQYEDFKDGIETKKEKINIEIEKLNQEIDEAKEYTLSDLIQKHNEEITIDLGKYSDLVKYLLSNGYIDENYNTYINKFHEGSITEKDYHFIMNVRNNKNIDYKEKLDNTEKIIKRLKDIDLKKEVSLNMYILDILLEDPNNIEKKDVYLNTLIKSSKYMEFIIFCICESNEFINKKNLIVNLCDLDKDILEKIKESKIEKKYKDLILELIIITIESNKLRELKSIDEIVIYIEKNNLLRSEKLEDIESKLIDFDIKFYNIVKFKNNNELYKYIIENNMYRINFNNILDILINNNESNKKEIEENNKKKIEENNKKKIEENNYSCISNNKKLKQYVDKNIQQYIDNVYSKLKNKQKNPVTIIKSLINNSNIKTESKYAIITKETNKIDNILEIDEHSLWKYIFQNGLIDIKWSNINSYYNEFKLDEALIELFNNKKEIESILQNNVAIEEQSSTNFVKDLMLCNTINENSYDLILKNSKYKLASTTISELNKERLIKLITNKRIECNLKMIEHIRNYSTEMLIVFIKNNYIIIHREIDNGNIRFTLDEINEIIKSDVTSTIKSKCLDMIKDQELEDMTLELIENIAVVSVENNFKNKMTEKMLLEVISNIDNIELKVKLINLNFQVVNRENISDCLDILGEDYKKIIIDRKRPKLEDNEFNKALLENIKSLGYNIKYISEDNNIVLSNTVR